MDSPYTTRKSQAHTPPWGTVRQHESTGRDQKPWIFKPQGTSNTYLELSYLHSHISLQSQIKNACPPIPPLRPCLLRLCSNVTAQVESIFPLYSHRLNLVPHSTVWVTLPWSPLGLAHRHSHPKRRSCSLSPTMANKHPVQFVSQWHWQHMFTYLIWYNIHVHQVLLSSFCRWEKLWLYLINTANKCLLLGWGKKWCTVQVISMFL